MKRTKIVATLGPSSSSPEVVRRLIEAGLNVARLNFSHGAHEDHARTFEIVRRQAEILDVSVAVLADLSGPKIRVGEMEGEGVLLDKGASLAVTTRDVVGTRALISTSYGALAEDVSPGDPILLNDGRLRLLVVKVDRGEVHCVVEVGGVLTSRKGMNLPGTRLSTPALTDKDRRDLEAAKSLGVDYVALSFVRRPEDVEEAKALAGEIPVIAKIEKPEAIECQDEIAAVADGLMVARGDLGVEAGAEKVPLFQKSLIQAGSSRGKPVIVATQMLESMVESPVPTRAEVSDVANAVLDGADALMLSGETAVGAYPVEAVRRMAAVIEEVESSDVYRLRQSPPLVDEYSFTNAISSAAVKATRDLGLRALVVHTASGHTAELVSAYRPMARLVAFCIDKAVMRRLSLLWGVRPVLISSWVENSRQGVDQVEEILLKRSLAAPGDDVAIIIGMQAMSGPGRSNVLALWRLRETQPEAREP